MVHLPTHFAGKPIGLRIPHSIAGELLVANATTATQFPDATFLNATDKPFEIHRAIISLTPFDNQATSVIVSPAVMLLLVQDLRSVLEDYIRLNVLDVSKNEKITKNAALVRTLLKNNERAWEWDAPYTIIRGEALQVLVDNIAPATFVAGAATVANIRVNINFQGHLLVISPASESR